MAGGINAVRVGKLKKGFTLISGVGMEWIHLTWRCNTNSAAVPPCTELGISARKKKLQDPTIADKFNIYKFADYKDQVIDLLMRVCAISVKTMEIVNQMADEEQHVVE